jgi:predicted secreted protein
MSTLIAGRNVFGSIFKYSSVGSSGTFTAVANIITISPPAYSRGSVDITNHGTTDYFEQHISGGPIRSGNVGITAVYISATSFQNATIPTDFAAGTRCGWNIIVAGPTSNNCWYGDGYITSYDPIAIPGMEGAAGFNMTLKVTGKPTLADSTT